jgi:hypothetical protein
LSLRIVELLGTFLSGLTRWGHHGRQLVYIHSTIESKEKQQEQQKEEQDSISHYKKVLLPLEYFVQMVNSRIDTGISVIIDMKGAMVSGDLVSLQEYHYYTSRGNIFSRSYIHFINCE